MIMNPFRFASASSAGADDYDSMYESRSALTTIQKQHFVEWFSGSALDSIWTTTNLQGTNTFAMNDAVNGGFRITTSTASSDKGIIHFNDINQYAYNGSVFIAVIESGGIGGVRTGFRSVHSGDSTECSLLNMDSGLTNIQLRTADASTTSTTDTGTPIAVHGNPLVMKIELDGSNNILTIDGVVEVTKSTNRPTVVQQPTSSMTGKASADTLDHRYMECYNT